MELKPGYKRTEVGVIPEEWVTSTVGREFEIKLGKMLDAVKNVGLSKPYVGNKSVQWDRIDVDKLSTMAMSRSDLERFRLRKGDLLVCEGGEVGRAAIWEAPIEECYYQKALHRLRPLRGFNVRLMVALLRYWAEHGLLSNHVTQTSIAHLTREKFAAVPMPVPSPEEQGAIAAMLGDVDALITALDQLIAKKRDLKQTAMQQLLTGERRLRGFQGGWETVSLGELFAFKNGLNKGKEFFGEGTPIVNYMDVYGHPGLHCNGLEGRVSLSKQERKIFDVRRGDVFFTRTSETVEEIGMAAVMLDDPIETVFSGFLLRARPKDNTLDNDFKKYCFASHVIRSQIVSRASYTTRALTNGRFLSLVTLQRPPLPEQTAIATVLSDMDVEINVIERRRNKTRSLKQGMMQALLTGRARLV